MRLYTLREVWYAGLLEFAAKWLSLSWAGVLAVACGIALIVGYWIG